MLIAALAAGGWIVDALGMKRGIIYGSSIALIGVCLIALHFAAPSGPATLVVLSLVGLCVGLPGGLIMAQTRQRSRQRSEPLGWGCFSHSIIPS